MERVIFHCDLNSFFASVELLTRPELRDKPVAVGGDRERRHGIILAKNDRAKTFGVKTAETIWQAKGKCPELIVLPPHHEKYGEYSRKVNEIYSRYSDRVEPFGIDESWLDMTGTYHLFGADPVSVADRIRREVKRELGLTVSVGVSFNKIFAKLGSDYRKPDATTLISRENFRSVVWPLPASDLLYVGRAAGERLARYGIRTIGDLAAAHPDALTELLGKQGGMLWEYAHGLENSPVAPVGQEYMPKSVGNGETFARDLICRAEVERCVAALAGQIAMRLRGHGLKATTLQVTIRDRLLRDICRQQPLDTPVCTARELAAAAMTILDRNWKEGSPIRALTLTAYQLVGEEETAEQLGLFGEEGRRRQRRGEDLERLMDVIRGKYGMGAVKTGLLISGGKNGDEVPF